MIKEFFRDSLIYGIGNFLTRGISFLLLPLYTRTLTLEDYGVTSFLSSIIVFFLPLISLEITQAIGIYYSEAKSEQEKKSYLSTAFTFLLATNLIFLILGIIFCKPLSSLMLGDSINKSILLVALLSTVSSTLFNFIQGQLLWRLKSIVYSVISFASTILTILVTFILVVVMKNGVAGVFFAGVVGNALGTFAGLFYSRGYFNLRLDIQKLKQMLHFSIPLVPSNLGYYALLYLDQIAVKHYFGLFQAGVYGVACRFVIIINLLIYALGSALPPLIYHHHHKQETKEALERIARLFLVGVFTSVCALAFLGNDIILIFTTPDYLDAAKLIPVLAIGTFFSNLYLLTPGLVIAKKTELIAAFNIIGGLLNMVGNIILVPRFGLMGAAIATLVSSFIIFVFYYLSSQYYYHIDFQWKKITNGIVLFLLVFGLSFFTNINFSDSAVLDILLKLIPMIILPLIFVWILTGKKERQYVFSNIIFWRRQVG